MDKYTIYITVIFILGCLTSALLIVSGIVAFFDTFIASRIVLQGFCCFILALLMCLVLWIVKKWKRKK